MGIDITYLRLVNPRTAYRHLKGTARAFDIWRRNMVSIAGEPVSENLCDDRSTSPDSGFVIFDDDSGGTATRHETVPVPVKRTTGRNRKYKRDEPGRIIETQCKISGRYERTSLWLCNLPHIGEPCARRHEPTAFIHVGRKRDQAETDGSVKS